MRWVIVLVCIAACGRSSNRPADASGVADTRAADSGGGGGGDAAMAGGDAAMAGGDAAMADGAPGDAPPPGMDQVWFTGDTMPVLRWDGSQITATATPANTYYSAWGTSPNSIYVLAWDGSVLHDDGSVWTTSRASTGQSLYYTRLFGFAADDVWGLGEQGTILRFDGTTWTAKTYGTINNWASCLWGAAPDDLWAVGYSPQIHHWDGAHWHDLPGLLGIYVFACWGTSSSNIWGVGQTLNQGSTPDTSTIAHYDGTSWTLFPVPAELDQPGQVLNAVWGSSATDVWAVGNAGLVAHWDGTTWSRIDLGTTRDLDAVGGSSAASVWVAGAQGTILHRDATGTWSPIASGTTKWIYGLWVTTDAAVY